MLGVSSLRQMALQTFLWTILFPIGMVLGLSKYVC